MYQTEDLILYGNAGVCRVEHIGPMDHPSSQSDPARLYYTLSPLYGSGSIYAPVDTAVFMRPILAADEVNSLIDQINDFEPHKPHPMTPKALADHCHTVLQSHSSLTILGFLVTLKRKSEEGKKLCQIEQRCQKQAETLLFGEFSSALGIPVEEIPAYIQNRLEKGSA